MRCVLDNMTVAPYAGAWIETASRLGLMSLLALSHPMRVRELKREGVEPRMVTFQVAPYGGAWIKLIYSTWP